MKNPSKPVLQKYLTPSAKTETLVVLSTFDNVMVSNTHGFKKVYGRAARLQLFLNGSRIEADLNTVFFRINLIYREGGR